MFKSTRKRQSNRLTFEEELNQQLHHLKEETPQKISHAQKNKQMANIIDEVVNELKTPIEKTPEKKSRHQGKDKLNEIRQIDSLQLDQNSSIPLNSKLDADESFVKDHKFNKIQKNHISNLVGNPQIIKILIENFRSHSESETIKLQDFIKKVYPFYFSIHIKQQELLLLKSRLKGQLTTTDPQILSLNALQIIAKRHDVKKYLQSAYINIKIDQKVLQYQKRTKRKIEQLQERSQMLKERELKLSLDEQQYEKKLTALLSKQKSINNKQRQITIRQKEIKRNIEQKMTKIYQNSLSQFGDKIKQTQKRLNNAEKNIKYKIEILQRRSQSLKALINEKNDLKNKKVMSENQAKIKLRRIQKEMEEQQKKHQSQIQIFQKQEKDLLKSIAILEEKISKHEKKTNKQKERILQLEEQLTLSSQKFEKIVQRCSELQQKLQKSELKCQREEDHEVKLQKQKTSRSTKNRKKTKSSQQAYILPLYELVLQSLNIQMNSSHYQYQQLLKQVMKYTLKQLPKIICLLTNSENQQNIIKQPHYLVLNIAKLVFSQFYYLYSKQEGKFCPTSKIKSTDIQELLKYPYASCTNCSLLLLLLDIWDWNQQSSVVFFSKTLHQIVQQIEQSSFVKQNQLRSQQLNLLTSPECSFFLINTFYNEVIQQFQSLQKDARNWLRIGISITDVLLAMIKIDQQSPFSHISKDKVDHIFFEVLLASIEAILKAYCCTGQKSKKASASSIIFESIQEIQELAQKMSILTQRFYYKYSKSLKKSPQAKKLKTITSRLNDLNRSSGNRHSLIFANLKSISQMIQGSE